MKILIVEDEIIIAESLKMMLHKLGHEVLGTCLDYEDFELYAQDQRPDVVLMDINLKQSKDGIYLAEKCQKRGYPFVYVTSYSDSATIQKAMKFNPLGYILKPFTERELEKTLEIVKVKSHQSSEEIYLKNGHDYIKLKLEDIVWLHAENVYTEIHTKQKKILYRSSLSDMLKLLPQGQFYRTHRSYAVNLNHVERVSHDHVVIGEAKVPYSRNKKQELIKKLA